MFQRILDKLLGKPQAVEPAPKTRFERVLELVAAGEIKILITDNNETFALLTANNDVLQAWSNEGKHWSDAPHGYHWGPSPYLGLPEVTVETLRIIHAASFPSLETLEKRAAERKKMQETTERIETMSAQVDAITEAQNKMNAKLDAYISGHDAETFLLT